MRRIQGRDKIEIARAMRLERGAIMETHAGWSSYHREHTIKTKCKQFFGLAKLVCTSMWMLPKELRRQ